MSVTEEIKSRIDIVDIVSEHVSLRKSGKNYSGFCPFHSNTRTPAFYVFPDTQTWHCFGECTEGGDVFSYVMKKEGWDFKEALKNLAQRAGVTLDEPDPETRVRRKAEDKLVDLLTAAAEYFHQLFLHAPQAEAARRYIQGRKLNEETIATYRIGFALNSWEACRTHFNAQGYGDEELLKVGLLSENPDRGTRYDRFRNRLMIPIRDYDGRVVGFGARTLDPDGVPKYLNSPQTPLFNKSHLLFGLDMARRYIREARQVVIVEGYMDVIMGWQAGYRNIVAQMGTALTSEQLGLLKRVAKRFVLALDADAAGAQATMRSLQVARETLDREFETQFDARGLVQHEGRLKADIHIVTLPEGNDPDKIIREHPDQWPILLDQAKPVVAYVIEIATRDLDLNDAKGKSAVAFQVLPLINDIYDPVEREHYRQQLARALRLDERTLRQIRLPQETPRRSPPPPVTTKSGSANKKELKKISGNKREANLLRQCLASPRLIIQVNQQLLRQGQQAIQKSDFTLTEDGEIMTLIYERADQPTVVTIDELCDSLDFVFQERLEAIMTLSESTDGDLAKLPELLAKSVLDWRLAAANAKLRQLEHLFRESRQDSSDGDDQNQLYVPQIKTLFETIKRINKAKDAISAAGQRRAEQSVGH